MATDKTNLAGEIAYQLTKRLVIDISTARAAVDAAISATTPAPAGQDKEDAENYRWLFGARTDAECSDPDVGNKPPLPQDMLIADLAGFYAHKGYVDAAIRAARGDEVNQK